MRRPLAVLTIVSLLSVALAFAVNARDAGASYVELADAPTITIDWSKGSMQAVTLHGNRTLIFENAQKGGRYTLIIKQDATGSRIPIWPPQVHWPGETQLPPTLTSIASKKDYLTFIYDGASYDVVGLAQNF